MAMAVQSYGYGFGCDDGYGYDYASLRPPFSPPSPLLAPAIGPASLQPSLRIISIIYTSVAILATVASSCRPWLTSCCEAQRGLLGVVEAVVPMSTVTFRAYLRPNARTSGAGPAMRVRTGRLLLPDGMRPPTRSRTMPGSTNRTASEAAGSASVRAMTPSPPRPQAWPDGERLCTPPRPPARSSGRHTPSPLREHLVEGDVDEADHSSPDVEYAPDEVDETSEADGGVYECLNSDDVDNIAIPREDDQISGTDAQQMVVQANQDSLGEEESTVVPPARKRRRRARRCPADDLP